MSDTNSISFGQSNAFKASKHLTQELSAGLRKCMNGHSKKHYRKSSGRNYRHAAYFWGDCKTFKKVHDRDGMFNHGHKRNKIQANENCSWKIRHDSHKDADNESHQNTHTSSISRTGNFRKRKQMQQKVRNTQNQSMSKHIFPENDAGLANSAKDRITSRKPRFKKRSDNKRRNKSKAKKSDHSVDENYIDSILNTTIENSVEGSRFIENKELFPEIRTCNTVINENRSYQFVQKKSGRIKDSLYNKQTSSAQCFVGKNSIHPSNVLTSQTQRSGSSQTLDIYEVSSCSENQSDSELFFFDITGDYSQNQSKIVDTGQTKALFSKICDPSLNLVGSQCSNTQKHVVTELSKTIESADIQSNISFNQFNFDDLRDLSESSEDEVTMEQSNEGIIDKANENDCEEMCGDLRIVNNVLPIINEKLEEKHLAREYGEQYSNKKDYVLNSYSRNICDDKFVVELVKGRPNYRKCNGQLLDVDESMSELESDHGHRINRASKNSNKHKKDQNRDMDYEIEENVRPWDAKRDKLKRNIFKTEYRTGLSEMTSYDVQESQDIQNIKTNPEILEYIDENNDNSKLLNGILGTKGSEVQTNMEAQEEIQEIDQESEKANFWTKILSELEIEKKKRVRKFSKIKMVKRTQDVDKNYKEMDKIEIPLSKINKKKQFKNNKDNIQLLREVLGKFNNMQEENDKANEYPLQEELEMKYVQTDIEVLGGNPDIQFEDENIDFETKGLPKFKIKKNELKRSSANPENYKVMHKIETPLSKINKKKQSKNNKDNIKLLHEILGTECNDVQEKNDEANKYSSQLLQEELEMKDVQTDIEVQEGNPDIQVEDENMDFETKGSPKFKIKKNKLKRSSANLENYKVMNKIKIPLSKINKKKQSKDNIQLLREILGTECNDMQEKNDEANKYSLQLLQEELGMKDVQTDIEVQEGNPDIQVENENVDFETKGLPKFKIKKNKLKRSSVNHENYKVMNKIETPLSKINKKMQSKNNKDKIQLLREIVGTECNDMQEKNDEANKYSLELLQEELEMKDVQTDIDVQEGNPYIQVKDEIIDFETKRLSKFKIKNNKLKRSSANPENYKIMNKIETPPSKINKKKQSKNNKDNIQLLHEIIGTECNDMQKNDEANKYSLELLQEELEIKDVQTDIEVQEGNPYIQVKDEIIDFETKRLSKFKIKNNKLKRSSANPENYKIMNKIETPPSKINKKKQSKNNKDNIQLLHEIIGTECNDMQKNDEANKYSLELLQEELEIKDVQTDIEVQEGNPDILVEDENIDFETKVLPKFKSKKNKLKRSSANPEMIQDTHEMQNMSIYTNPDILDENGTNSTKTKKTKRFEDSGNSELQHRIVGVEYTVQEENVESPTTDKIKMTKKVKGKKKLKRNVTETENVSAGVNLLGKETLETHSNTTIKKKINKKRKDFSSIPDSTEMYNVRYTDDSGSFEFPEDSHIERGTILSFEDDVEREYHKSRKKNQRKTELLENILGSRPNILEELKKNDYTSEVTEAVDKHNAGIHPKQRMPKEQISTNLSETSLYTIVGTKFKNKENHDTSQSTQSCRENSKLHETFKNKYFASEVLISDELGKEIRGMQANETQFKWSDLMQMASKKAPKKVRGNKCKNFIHIIDSDCEMHVTLNGQSYKGSNISDRGNSQTFYGEQNDSICKEFVDIVDSDCTMRTFFTNTRKRKRNKKSNESLKIVDRDNNQTSLSEENNSICREFVDIVDSDCTMGTTLINTRKKKRIKKSNEGLSIADVVNNQTFYSEENDSICKEFVDSVDRDCTMRTTWTNTIKEKRSDKSKGASKISHRYNNKTFNSEENDSICKEFVDIVDSDCTMGASLTNTKKRKRNRKSNLQYDDYLEVEASIQTSSSNIDSSMGNVSSNQNEDKEVNETHNLGNESIENSKNYEYSKQVQLKSKEHIDSGNNIQKIKQTTSQVSFNKSESQKELSSGTRKSHYSNSPKENICLVSEKKKKKHYRNEQPLKNSVICSQKFEAKRSRHIEPNEHDLELQEELKMEHVQSDTEMQEGGQAIDLKQQKSDFDANNLSELEIKKKKRSRTISKTEVVQDTQETMDINCKILERKLCDQNEKSTENFINGILNSSDKEVNETNNLGNESIENSKDNEYSKQVQLKSKERIDSGNNIQKSKQITSQVSFNDSESQKELSSGTRKSYYSNSPKENICLVSEKKKKKHYRNETPLENSEICPQKFKAKRSRHIEPNEHELELQEELKMEHVQSDTEMQEGGQAIDLKQQKNDLDANNLSELEIKKKKRSRMISETEIVQDTQETMGINCKILERKLCDRNEKTTENFINGILNSPDKEVNEAHNLGNESIENRKDYEYSKQVQLKSKERIDSGNNIQKSKQTSQVSFEESEYQKQLSSGTRKYYYSNSPKENICLVSEKKKKKHCRNETPFKNSDICSQKFKAKSSSHRGPNEHELELQEELRIEHVQSDTEVQEGGQGIDLKQQKNDLDGKHLSELEIKRKKRRRTISKTEIVQVTQETMDINCKILEKKLCDQNGKSTENFINGILNSSDSEQLKKKQSHNLKSTSDKNVAEKTAEQTNPGISYFAPTELDERNEEPKLERNEASSGMESTKQDGINSFLGPDEVKVDTQEIKQPYGNRNALIQKIYNWGKGLFNKTPKEDCEKSMECRKSSSENKCLTLSQMCKTTIDEARPDDEIAPKISKSVHSENSDNDSVKSEASIIEDKFDPKELSLSVPFSIPPLHEHLADSKQESEAASLGIALKKGPFNKEEDKQIMDNWTYFCKFHNLTVNPEDFFNVQKIRVVERLKFLQFLAHGLDTRKLHRVHMRFKTIFKKNVVRRGRYTAEEDAQIIDYIKNTRSKTPYKDLAEMFNRTNLSVQRRYETLTKARNTGRVVWNVRSMARFVAKLMRVKKVKDVSDLKDAECTTKDWRKLSKKLDYIPIERLRRAWNITIYPRLFAESVDLVQMKKDIITTLYESDINDWKLINWKTISEKYAGYTSQKVYMMFRHTMVHHVPKEKRGDVRECLSYLMRNVIEKDKLQPPHTIKRFIAEMSEESSESEDDTK